MSRAELAAELDIGPLLQPQPMPMAGQRLVVAAWSARALAELAAAEGAQVWALDLFGDADTRSACAQRWAPLGAPGPALRIDAQALCDGLRQAAGQGATGWLAGSGFEADPALLAAGAQVLPLWGSGARVLQQVADPARFFALLAAAGVPHPPVHLSAQGAAGPGWLRKQAGGSGGGHVQAQPVDADGLSRAPAGHYLQRWAPGQPMSATLVANGHAAVVLGINRQWALAEGPWPHRFAGVLGPVALPAAALAALQRALQTLVPACGLRGLASLDFLLHGQAIQVLELNARPPASTALYADQAPIHAHWQACVHGRLPAAPPAPGHGLQGLALVYARRARPVGPALAAALAALPGCHDLPAATDLLDVGSPVCSLAARGHDPLALRQQLDAGCAHVHHLLETLHP